MCDIISIATTGAGICKECGASLGSSPSFWNPVSGLCILCDPVDWNVGSLMSAPPMTCLHNECKPEDINKFIQDSKVDTNLISDGYHTFGELYEHRIQIFITLCRIMSSECSGFGGIWRAKRHNDGSEYEGWFCMGIGKAEGEQITYHLPISSWGECNFAETLETAPPWDGHTSADVLERLKRL